MAAGSSGRKPNRGKAVATSPTATGKWKAKQRRTDKPFMQLTPEVVSLLSAATSAAHSFLLSHDLLLLPGQTLAIESHLNSISGLLSSLQTSSSIPKTPPLSTPPPPPQPQHQHCWFHRFLSSAADDDPRWATFFRMSKPSFAALLRLLYPALQSIAPLIHPLYALGSAIYRLAHAAPYKAVARRFGLRSSDDACRSFFALLKAANDKLGNLLELYSDMDRVVFGFRWASLPNCCGVLGFGRFEVEGNAPGPNKSFLVQAVVDTEGRFLDVSAGWPCTLKPDSILRKTKLFSAVEESKELLNGPSFELRTGQLIPQYLLGDACFPLLPWLITPYRNHPENGENLSSKQRSFNSVHDRAMGFLNLAFSRLGAQWKLLSKPWKEECIDFFPFAIFAGCLLHNFLIKAGEVVSDQELGSSLKEFSVYEGEESVDGGIIRDALAGNLARVTRRR